MRRERVEKLAKSEAQGAKQSTGKKEQENTHTHKTTTKPHSTACSSVIHICMLY